MLRAGPARHVRAALGYEFERHVGSESVNLRQIHSQKAVQRGSDIEGNGVGCPVPFTTRMVASL